MFDLRKNEKFTGFIRFIYDDTFKEQVMTNSERFSALCAQEYFLPEGGVGTLGEKRLHAVLKRYYEPRAEFREISVGRIVADIKNEEGITEIQTGSYSALAKKLPRLLYTANVRVVCPVPAKKRIAWINPDTGEISDLRKSPKTGHFIDAAYHLCRIAPFLRHTNLQIDILLVDLDEYRLQNGWAKEGKRGSVRADRLPQALAGSVTLAAPSDWLCLLPDSLPDPFTTTDLRQCAKRSANLCAKTVKTLLAAGAITRCGKQKNSILYTKITEESSMRLSDFSYIRPDEKAVCAKLAELTSALQTAPDAKTALDLWGEFCALQDEFGTMATVASIRHSCDTTDAFYDAENDFFDEASPLVENAQNEFRTAFLQSPYQAELEKKLGSLLFEKLDLAVRSNSAEIIGLLQEENALTSRYTKLYASAKIEFEGQELTVSQMALYKRSPDRAMRRRAMAAEGAWFDAHRTELDEIFDRLVANRTEQAKKLGFQSYTDLSYLRMGRCGYGKAEVAACRKAVAEELVPMICELKMLQAERIGLSRLAYYDDTFRFKEGNAAPIGTPDEILAAGKKMYEELSPETAEYIDFMLDGGLFDVLSRPGKAPGGYCTYIPALHAPFIFSNFNATADDVDVLTHEAGHGFEMYLAGKLDLPAELREPGLESCEIHSMSMEFLTHDFHHLFFGEGTARYQLAHAEDSVCFLPYGCLVDEFQHIIYDQPNLTADERNAVWLELERKYRPWIDFETLPFYSRGAGWQRQLHIYQYPFYYIDYCLAQVVALQFFAAHLADPTAAWKSYLALTKLAGTKTYAELVEAAGLLTPFSKKNVKNACKPVVDWIKNNQC